MGNMIIGAGGGSSDDARAPVEAPDSLRSKQVARIVDVVSEGEIVGLKNGLRSVYLNETPIQNLDGSFNFKDVSVEQRYGTVNQDAISGTSGTEFEVGVGAEVKAAVPITRTMTTPNVGAVRVTLGIPQLTEQNMKNGDLNGSSVAIRIQVQQNGAGFVDKVVDTIRGKTTSRYQTAYMIALSGNGPWDIRVVRDTPDSTNSSINNQVVFDSFTGIIPARLAYPNTAYIGLRVDAANFNSIPSRAYHVRGLIVKVPTNYNPVTRAYTGIWDGTFKLAWTDNPAWCFFDMLINDRYGLGRFIQEQTIDKWALYSIARYCDQMVSNGRGGMEPRFTCNLYLQTREDAYKVIQNFASIFRAITYWGGGSIVASQDRPSDPVMQFNNTSVEDGAFSYSGTSLKQRHTVALVAWNDPQDFYRQKVEYVQDDDLVARYGIMESELTAFGCSSQGQAHRFGRWLLATERFSNETISFKAGLDGLSLYPGAVFQTSDQNRAGARMAGRILAIDNDSGQRLTVDAPVEFTPGHTYRMTVVSAVGAMEHRELSTITSADGTILTPASAFGSLEPGVPFIITDVGALVPEQWRVLSIVESAPGIVEITGLAYVAGLYDNVEKDFIIDAPPVSVINTRPPQPTMLGVAVSQYRVDGQLVGLRALVSWMSNLGRFRLAWRKLNGQWNSKEVTETSYEIESVDPTTYEFMVTAIGSNGRESNATRLVLNLATGAADAVETFPAPANLRLVSPYVRADAMFAWDSVPGALGYEVQVSPLASPFSPVRIIDLGDSLTFTYDPVDMRQDGGPFRSLSVRVRAYTVFNKKGDWANLTVGNPQVSQLSGVQVSPGLKNVYFQCAEPDDLDFSGIILWLGTTPNFVPSDANMVYSGPGVFGSFGALPDGSPLTPGATYYLKAAGYDAIGKDSLNISGSFAITVFGNAPDRDSIIADMIKDGALTITKFADGIEPVGVFDTLPALGGATPYTGPTTINVSGKLYSLINGEWVGNVASVGPGSVGEDALDAGLATRIDLIDGPETTPGTVANVITGKVSELSDLVEEKLDYVGSLSQTAIAAARVAIKAQSTAAEASVLYTNTIAAKLGNDITAAVFAESEVRATELQSIASQFSGLSVTWQQDISAAINTFNQTVASANYASATSVSQLSATVGGHTTTLQQSSTVIAGLKSRVETKIDANGVITGYALDVDTPRTGPATSTMTFAVDAFRIQGTGANATPVTPIFEVVTAGANKSVKISGVHIKDGTLSADKIIANSITAAQIAVGTITAEQLKAGAITTDILVVGVNGGIPGTMIKDGAISTEKLAADSITGNKIVANSITTGHIVADAITGDKIAVNTITANKIDTRGMTIKGTDGTILFGSGTALDWSNIAGANKPEDGANKTTNTNQLVDGAGLGTKANWNNIAGMLNNLKDLNGAEGIKNNLVTLASDGTLNGGGGGKVSITGLGFFGDLNATQNTGPFAMLNGKITAEIASAYFAANSISGTYISNLAADKILAGTLGAGVGYFGTVSANQITAGSLTTANILIPSSAGGALLDVSYNGLEVGYRRLEGYNINASNLSNPSVAAVRGVQVNSGGGCGLEGNGASGGTGLVGYGGYAFYSASGTVGPFTGSHDGLVALDHDFVAGDIAIDFNCVVRRNVSNTLFDLVRSSTPRMKGAIGVFAADQGVLDKTAPAAMVIERRRATELIDDFGAVVYIDNNEYDPSYAALRLQRRLVVVNSVGEGQINVCGENGDIERGDLIVTSSMPGKGMRQDDDCVRSITVARARESVTFSAPDEVKMIACIYLAG